MSGEVRLTGEHAYSRMGGRPERSFPMTENTTSSLPPTPVDRPGRTSPWLPQSWTAAGVLLLTSVAAAWPAILAAAWSYFDATGCFFDCTEPDPVRAVALGALAVLLVLSPFAAVRLLQSRGRPSAGARLGIILITDFAGIVFSVNWLWLG